MREAFRVVFWDPTAARGRPGHGAYVPREFQGNGRVDNPALYGVLYLSDSPAGAVAEQFAWFPVWDRAMFEGGDRPTPVSFALARFKLAGTSVLDLDEPARLGERHLRPSGVVSSNRELTQAWSRAIFGEGAWAGVRWWSRWDSRWTSLALWDRAGVRMTGPPIRLHPEHAAVKEAGAVLNRSWRDS